MRKHLPTLLYLVSAACLLAGLMMAAAAYRGGGLQLSENTVNFGFRFEGEDMSDLAGIVALLGLSLAGALAAWWLSRRDRSRD